MDRIVIEGLALEACIGVHAWEAQLPRRIVFDLELGTDARRGARTDRLADALDYVQVAAVVAQVVQAGRLNLIETLAERVAAALFARFDLSSLKLTLHKPGALAEARDILLVIERGRSDYPR